MTVAEALAVTLYALGVPLGVSFIRALQESRPPLTCGTAVTCLCGALWPLVGVCLLGIWIGDTYTRARIEWLLRRGPGA